MTSKIYLIIVILAIPIILTLLIWILGKCYKKKK